MKQRIPSFDDFDLNESNVSAKRNVDEKAIKERAKLLEKNLQNIVSICKKHNVRYWLDGGTLLGPYRDKKFIEGDSDNDIGIRIEDVTPEFIKALGDNTKFTRNPQSYMTAKDLLPYFDEDEYYPVRNVKYATLEKNGRPKIIGTEIWTDVYFYCPSHDKSHYNFKSSGVYYRQPAKFLDKLGSLTHNGFSYKVPGDVEGYLAHEYGKGWKTPDSKYRSYEDPDRKDVYAMKADDYEKKFGKMMYNFKTKDLKYEK